MLLPDTILVIDEHLTEHNLSTSSLVRGLASFQGMSQREELSESYHPPYAPCDPATPDTGSDSAAEEVVKLAAERVAEK